MTSMRIGEWGRDRAKGTKWNHLWSYLLVLPHFPLGCYRICLFSHVPKFPSSHEPCSQYLFNIFPVLWLTGCSHINNAPLTWRAGTSSEQLSKSPCFLTNSSNSTMTYWKHNMNKERQVLLYDANRVTIKFWIRKYKASKWDPNTKNTEILRVFWCWGQQLDLP